MSRKSDFIGSTNGSVMRFVKGKDEINILCEVIVTKLIELLDKAMETGKVIYVSGWALGMIYDKTNGCFTYCDPVAKKLFHKVILCGKILKTDGWVLLDD